MSDQNGDSDAEKALSREFCEERPGVKYTATPTFKYAEAETGIGHLVIDDFADGGRLELHVHGSAEEPETVGSVGFAIGAEIDGEHSIEGYAEIEPDTARELAKTLLRELDNE